MNSKETFKELSQSTLKFSYDAQSPEDYEKAMDKWEDLQRKYPDSIRDLFKWEMVYVANQVEKETLAFNLLFQLLQNTLDEDGLPGFVEVLSLDAPDEYSNLVNKPLWSKVEQIAQAHKKSYYKELELSQDEFYRVKPLTIDSSKDARELYEQLKNYGPYLDKEKSIYSLSFAVKDTLNGSFLVKLPPNYTSSKKYPVLIVLHGAVRFTTFSDFQVPSFVLGDHHRYYTQLSDVQDVILIFPSADKNYNWMTSQEGFFMVPSILRKVKKALSIDDNKVFLTGHSNGATGSFSYWMKDPSDFAGFFGFNTYPKVFTGGTFLENAKNSSFTNFSTDQDYYYPPWANDTLNVVMDSLGANYADYRYNGYPHWFPEFKASKAAVEILFSSMEKNQREPLPKEILWQWDDNANGNIHWLAQMQLDTLSNGYKPIPRINFTIDKWLEYSEQEGKEDDLIEVEVKRKAFSFAGKSARIKANYDQNTFHITTQNVGSLCVLISPEQINMQQPVSIYINDQLMYSQVVEYDKDFMLENFNINQDRSKIWVNKICLDIF